MAEKGIFIVIDGTDGAGKSTQLEKLQGRLKRNKVHVKSIHFPQHGKPSAYFIDQYLNGKYGARGEDGINVQAVSLLFALDRFDATQKIVQELGRGNVVIADRYTSSNMGHQGAKLRTKGERKKYFKWIDTIEFKTFRIVRPTITIVLHMPAAIATTLIERKGVRAYVGGKKKDILEADLEHLQKAERVYIEIATLFPEYYKVVECVEGERLLSVDEIHERIWSVVAPLLNDVKSLNL